uniref:Uncharacterized protein n=1 Tax=viral metagenome TaxID=1070528 RepID=A0A6M3KLH2_9ZZZZ
MDRGLIEVGKLLAVPVVVLGLLALTVYLMRLAQTNRERVRALFWPVLLAAAAFLVWRSWTVNDPITAKHAGEIMATIPLNRPLLPEELAAVLQRATGEDLRPRMVDASRIEIGVPVRDEGRNGVMTFIFVGEDMIPLEMYPRGDSSAVIHAQVWKRIQ